MFKKFQAQNKVSEAFIVHEKVEEILPVYNKVPHEVPERFQGRETSPDQWNISERAGQADQEGVAPHPACRRR